MALTGGATANSSSAVSKGASIPQDRDVQTILGNWQSDLEKLSGDFYREVEEMTAWDRVIFKNNETIFGLQQQIAVMDRLQSDARHRVALLDDDQKQVSSLFLVYATWDAHSIHERKQNQSRTIVELD